MLQRLTFGKPSLLMKTARPKQHTFLGSMFKAQKAFGGSLLKRSNAKTKRVVSTSAPMHVVLRSEKARGSRSMLARPHVSAVDRIIREDARYFGVRVLEFANVGNHVHLLVRAGNRRGFLWFLSSISGRLAMLLTGSRKGQPSAEKFWDYRPFSRVVVGWRGYRVARDYVLLNEMEAAGVVPPRSKERSG